MAKTKKTVKFARQKKNNNDTIRDEKNLSPEINIKDDNISWVLKKN